jgi:ABC-type multidrug transport system fused ATPase/permease subunit
MTGIVGFIALLVILGLSLVITRLATTALAMTGLSYEAARFQARSAFTGTGFTTRESEQIVNHPVRRKIITLLMIVRSAGLITILLSLMLSFGLETDSTVYVWRLSFILIGVLFLLWLSSNKIVDRALNRVMRSALKRWTKLDVQDYASLLNLASGFTITEMHVDPDDWVAGTTLAQCRLSDEGVTMLGIQRANGDYVGVPKGDTDIFVGDRLLLYGHVDSIRLLDERRKGHEGESDHRKAVRKQMRREAEQERIEREKRDERQKHAEQSEAAERAALEENPTDENNDPEKSPEAE